MLPIDSTENLMLAGYGAQVFFKVEGNNISSILRPPDVHARYPRESPSTREARGW
jgi:hypothetical protein